MVKTTGSQETRSALSAEEQERSTLGKQVRQARVRLAMSQEELAEAAGVGVGTIKNIESAKTKTQRSKMEAVLAVLGLDRTSADRWDREQQQFAESAVALWSQLPESARPAASGRVVALLGQMIVESVSQADVTLAASDADLDAEFESHMEEP